VELALISLVAAVIGFTVGRWWAIAAVVDVVAVVWMTLIPDHVSFRLENGGADIGWLADLALLFEVFLSATLVGGAAAVGFGVRIVTWRLLAGDSEGVFYTSPLGEIRRCYVRETRARSVLALVASR
jgi:hypothetical protein